MGLFDAIGNVVAAGVDVAVRTPLGVVSDVIDPFKDKSDTVEALKDAKENLSDAYDKLKQ